MLRRLFRRSSQLEVVTPSEGDDLLAAARAERALRRAPSQPRPGVRRSIDPDEELTAKPTQSEASVVRHPHATSSSAALARRNPSTPEIVDRSPRPLERAGGSATGLDGRPTVSVRELVDELDATVLAFLSAQFAREARLLPYRLDEDGTLWVATARPPTHRCEQQTRWIVGLCRSDIVVEFAIADARTLDRAIDAHYPAGRLTETALSSLRDLADMFGPGGAGTSHVLGDVGIEGTRGLVEHLLCLAVERRASDILVDVWDTDLIVRFKVDGACESVLAGLPAHAGPQVISVVKQMARLKIYETEAQQSGGYEATLLMGDTPRRVEFRVEVTPTIYGESCSIRVHDGSTRRVTLAAIGADRRTTTALRGLMSTRRGMLVLSGPTESGKTTTLYAALGEADLERENVVAIEDPVEIRLRGIRPIQVNEAKGITFASSLRSILRQNPDRVLIGEIRDRETANLAVFAALTGHQVLTTVHADDAPRTVVRMLKEGIEPHNLAAILDLVIAQRLVGRICELCAEAVEYSEELLLAAQFEPHELEALYPRRGRGCKVCRLSGIDGRVALHETLAVTERIRAAIEGEPASVERAVRRIGIEEGMVPLRRAALDLVRAGVTSLEQVLLATPPMVS
jgi:type IV pilus assembly protein PilB